MKKSQIRTVGLAVFLLLLGVSCQDSLQFNDSKNPSNLAETSQTSTVSGTSTTSSSSLPHTNITELDLPVQVAYELSTYDCSNNPGPKITFSGLAATAGFGVRTIFRNNMVGTHEHVEESAVDVSLQPNGSQIVIPKQPVLGGVGGNPFIWIQFVNEQGQAVTGEIFIGRCVQGYTFKGAQSVAENAQGTTKYTVSGCENSPGPNITFEAGLSVAGLNARIIFRNNDNKVGGPHEATATISSDLSVIPSGSSWTFPKQPVLGGVGGNPWIWTQFLNGSGAPVSGEILLGRCEQLSKAL